MKKYLLMTIVVTISFSCLAQTWDEWTQQKKTQIKYLLQQIAANKVYIGYLQKGYSIANKGLTTIRSIKNGDFNLHHDFFESLNTVNPKIKNSGKVAAIIAFQIRITKESKQSLERIKAMSQFTRGELAHCTDVFDNLLEDCLKNIDELFLVIGSELAMRDDERMKRIDKLYTDMQSKYAFCSSFSNEMGVLAVQRMSEQSEINKSKLIR